jgi:hypothetical protein
VTSEVVVYTNAGDAVTNYTLKVYGATRFLKGAKPLHLPAYGDKQHADFFAGPENSRGEVIVLRANVVWNLTVQTCGALAPYSCRNATEPPKLTLTQALAELKKYAAKQRIRVGDR